MNIFYLYSLLEQSRVAICQFGLVQCDVLFDNGDCGVHKNLHVCTLL